MSAEYDTAINAPIPEDLFSKRLSSMNNEARLLRSHGRRNLSGFLRPARSPTISTLGHLLEYDYYQLGHLHHGFTTIEWGCLT